MKPFTEYPGCSSSENSTPSLFACSESLYLKAYRDDKQKTSAAYSLSTVEGIQQISRCRQHSRRGSDSAVRCGCTLRIDQTVNTNRSRRGAGTHVYNPHLLDNRSTSSTVCKAGALVSPSSCLDGEPHGWVPVDTHSTPVPSSTGEAVGGLSNFTSPIHHRNTRNLYMVAEQEFRTTTPEPASQRPRRRDSQPQSSRAGRHQSARFSRNAGECHVGHNLREGGHSGRVAEPRGSYPRHTGERSGERRSHRNHSRSVSRIGYVSELQRRRNLTR